MKFTECLNNIESKLKNWWKNGDQKEPLIIAKTTSYSVDYSDSLTDYWENTDKTVKRLVNEIDNSNYYGVAIPYHYIDFGASAMAGVLGANMEYVDKETIWGHSIYNSLEEVLDIKIDKNNTFYKMIYDLTNKSVEAAKDHHMVSNYALGGVGDTLSSLYGTENMLVDFYEEEELMKKTLQGLKEIWIAEFRKTNEIIAKSGNKGNIGWAGVWAPGTTFPIQEDMSYMISNEMFKEFFVPHISDMIDSMEYPFYHLDGIGQIPHLDTILQFEKLKVVQWQPGAGKEDLKQWYELIKKIIDNKKSVQLYSRVEEVKPLVEYLGSAKGLLCILTDATEENLKYLK